MAEMRKRMHIHLIDAAINLRAKGYRPKVYPRCEVYAAGRLELICTHFGANGVIAGHVKASIKLDTSDPNPKYWRWDTSLPWLLALHSPASIIPRRKCQLSSLDLAPANNHIANASNMVSIPSKPTQVVEQLSLRI